MAEDKTDFTFSRLSLLVDKPTRPARLVELQTKVNRGEIISEADKAELIGLTAFPHSPRGAELRRKQTMAEMGLGESLTSDEEVELQKLYVDRNASLYTYNSLERSKIVIPEGKTDSERRILYLIGRVSPSDRDVLYGELKGLVKDLESPQAAKKDWLIRVFKKKKWIDDVKVAELQNSDVSESLNILQDICRQRALLRIADQPFNVDLPDVGSELGDFIHDKVQSRGIDPQKCKVRYIDNTKYLSTALATGNDRSSSSIADYFHHGGRDGEEIAMIRSGITDATDTTYVSNLISWRSAPKSPNCAVLVYSGDVLEGIGPAGYMKSNGFHAFYFGGDIKRRSLLGIFKR